MDQWVRYFTSKRDIAAVAVAKFDSASNGGGGSGGAHSWVRTLRPAGEPEEEEEADEAEADRAALTAAYEEAEAELRAAIRVRELMRAAELARPSPHTLGVSLFRAHLGSSSASAPSSPSPWPWPLATVVDKLLPPSKAELADQTQRIVAQRQRHDAAREEWVQAMQARLRYHEDAFAREWAKTAKLVALRGDVLFRYMRASSPDGLRPKDEVLRMLTTPHSSGGGGGKPKPANAKALVRRSRELDDIRALCRGVASAAAI